MRKRCGVLVLSSVVLLGATACASGAKLSEVGPRFQQDAQQMLDRVAESHALEDSKPTVKQDAGCRRSLR